MRPFIQKQIELNSVIIIIIIIIIIIESVVNK